MEIKEYLTENIDPAYLKFNKNIAQSPRPMLGVRIPVLRKLAQQIAKGDFSSFLARPITAQHSYEELMVHSFVVGYAAWPTVDECLEAVERVVALIDNWGVCDCFCATLKITIKNQETMLTLIEKCLADGREFHVRFGIVMLLSYYLTDKYIDLSLTHFERANPSDYYVMMGVAWAVSVAYVKYPERTLPLLRDRKLEQKTHLKSIQKIVDSYRVSPANKTFIKSLR